MESVKSLKTNILMPLEQITKEVLSNYNISVISIENIKFKDTEKQRAVYKITTTRGIKCLKKVFYNEENLLFIYSVIEWLNLHNVNCPKLIYTKQGTPYFKYNNNIFVLTDWIEGRKCDYDNLEDVYSASNALAKIHISSKGFLPIDGSILNKSNVNYFESLNKHFLNLLEYSNKAFIIKDKFSKIFLEYFDYYIQTAKESTFLLSKIDFSSLIGDAVSNSAICHLDYVNKNIIFDSDNNLHVIDFDNTQLDFPVHDLSKFFSRLLKRETTNWDFNIFKNALEQYETVRPLSYTEHSLLLAFLMFPSKYWKISRDYYKNRNQCNKDSFITIIKKITKQQKTHDLFCSQFKDYINQKFKE